MCGPHHVVADMRAVVVSGADLRGRITSRVAYSLREDITYLPEGEGRIRAD